MITNQFIYLAFVIIIKQILNFKFKKKNFNQVDAANPPFPRPVAHWWYGCQNIPATFSSLGNHLTVQPSNSDSGDVDDLVFDAGRWNRPLTGLHNNDTLF